VVPSVEKGFEVGRSGAAEVVEVVLSHVPNGQYLPQWKALVRQAFAKPIRGYHVLNPSRGTVKGGHRYRRRAIYSYKAMMY
jgi:hypothetical protein